MNFAFRALAFAALLAVPAAALATDIKVPGDYDTIQDAVDAVDGPGFRILISKGTYPESVVVSDKSDFAIVGKGHPLIQGQEGLPGLSIQGGDGISVSGLDFEGGISGMDLLGPQNVVLSKLRISGSEGAGISASNVRSLEIKSCSVDATFGAGIRCESTRNLVISKCKVTGVGAEGIDVLSASTGQGGGLAGVITGNTVASAGLTGINYSGGAGIIEKNKVTDSGDAGMSVLAGGDADMSIAKNKVDRSGGAGIEAEGDALTVSKNKVSSSSGNGYSIQGTGALVEKNQATTGTVGIALAGFGAHTAVKNKVKTPAGNGINITSPGNSLEKNKVIAAGANGYFVTTLGNTFTSNKAKGSGGSGLTSLLPETENTFDKNKFGTESFGD